MGFADLKKNSKKNFEDLSKQVEKLNQGGFQADERYWTVTRDKAGNGGAVIRFLPACEGEDIPFVRLWNHAFQESGGWYIENSRTTLGEEDPCSELNRATYALGTEAAKKIVNRRKRKLNYIANIYVVKDPGNPANEGKVFLFKFGKKIWDMIQAAMHPDEMDIEAGVEPINPFDFWDGANFNLRVKTVDRFPNYDASKFSAKAVLGKDAEMEKIYNQIHSLQAEIAADKFKPYDVLKKRLEKVLGQTLGGNTESDEDEDQPEERPAPKQARKPAPKADEDDGDDDDMAFFNRINNSE